MLPFRYLAVFALVAVTFAQDYDYDSPPRPRPAPARVNPSYSGPTAPKPTPVPILKQINRHNEDGSYTYGYEGADGSFKIETKLPTGEVKGKYGYVDDTGKVRVVEYGATKYGFEPSGEGITVAPPTLVDETTNKDGTLNQEYGYDQQEPLPAPIVRQQAPVRPRPRPQAYSPPQQFEPAPQDDSPVPPRAVIPGAQQVQTQTFDFGPVSRPSQPQSAPVRSFTPAARPPPVQYARPAPIDDYDEPRQAAPRPAPPKITYAQPAPLGPPAGRSSPPQYAPRPSASQYVPRPASPRGGGGILDQLQQDYALPSNGAAPLHDISFGYY